MESVAAPPTNPASNPEPVCIGTGDIYVVPSRTDPEKVYVVTGFDAAGARRFACNCVARGECWHLRAVQKLEFEAAQKPKLTVITTPKREARALDFSNDEPTSDYVPSSWSLA